MSACRKGLHGFIVQGTFLNSAHFLLDNKIIFWRIFLHFNINSLLPISLLMLKIKLRIIANLISCRNLCSKSPTNQYTLLPYFEWIFQLGSSWRNKLIRLALGGQQFLLRYKMKIRFTNSSFRSSEVAKLSIYERNLQNFRVFQCKAWRGICLSTLSCYVHCLQQSACCLINSKLMLILIFTSTFEYALVLFPWFLKDQIKPGIIALICSLKEQRPENLIFQGNFFWLNSFFLFVESECLLVTQV